MRSTASRAERPFSGSLAAWAAEPRKRNLAETLASVLLRSERLRSAGCQVRTTSTSRKSFVSFLGDRDEVKVLLRSGRYR